MVVRTLYGAQMKGLGKYYKNSYNGSIIYAVQVSKKLDYQRKVHSYAKKFLVFRVFDPEKSIEIEKKFHIQVEVTYFRSR